MPILGVDWTHYWPPPLIELSSNKLTRLEESVFKGLMEQIHNRSGSILLSASE